MELTSSLADIDRYRTEIVTPTMEELVALGSIVTIEGFESEYPLRLNSLQRASGGNGLPRWLLLTVSPADLENDVPEKAMVWVNDQNRPEFLKLFEDYANRNTKNGQPANLGLVANIARIRATVLADLWQSSGQPNTRGTHWWEVWMRPDPNAVELLRSYAGQQQLRISSRSMTLSDRIVSWIEAPWIQLQALPFTAVPVAEIRRPEFIDTIEDLGVEEQNDYVSDLMSRVVPAPYDAPAVCHLDSGVARTHILIEGSLHEDDLHTVVGNDGFDRSGHGTSMAGIALFGSTLDAHLLGTTSVVLTHRLESVRILPRRYETVPDPVTYGDITAQAIAAPEVVTQRPRVFCLPVTHISDLPDHPGQPTLWSATLDALVAGVDVERDGEHIKLLSAPDSTASRLIVVSAGNIDTYSADHLASSDNAPIEDPGQAWNAITVGAYTTMNDTPTHPDYTGWTPVAATGELSPHSRTSHRFGTRPWPIKPDIVLEGGNVLTDGTIFEERHPLLSLRTTGTDNNAALTSANATSAATAQAARLAAITQAAYPNYWPETIRGLLVHAARWTPEMSARIGAESTLEARQHLLRRYGWGVPTESGVLTSSNNSVTMVVEDQFVPFVGETYSMPALRLHDLPWPVEVLQSLGPADLTLTVTLSYYIEPTASRRGWRQRYSYPSHGLRFELQDPLENESHFLRRLNRQSRGEEVGDVGPASSQVRWTLGSRQRHYGSLHQDIWETTGPALADCATLAVYPVGGWWKRNSSKKRIDQPVRYSLVVSIRTPAADVDLYTPILNSITTPVETPIDT
ncbi:MULTISPECIES: S8 family peptidase [unclassified Rhodococcus (in: high G+C Gram-positive bacteria)]|uniref:S8 family peptidase n=1 Tax=unclassified Rhodococcus (in: high G+C Gram-positive bacteria) TaxID=192944 RepID=UPI000A9BC470|nr:MULTISPECIES: S8 family peptidase [unclassified Rhodococcus (in: high G+C Gram-positive bacteria)]